MIILQPCFKNVDSLKDYNVDFVKLKLGQHSFNYRISDSFFKIKEHSLIEQGEIDVHLLIDKKERLMNLTFTFQGKVRTDCDICLDSIQLPVKGEETMVVKIVEQPRESDSEILYLGPNDISFNIYDPVYEFICTSLPLSKACRDDISGTKVCNPAMLKFLSESKEENSSIENETDPRWDKLKNIKE